MLTIFRLKSVQVDLYKSTLKVTFCVQIQLWVSRTQKNRPPHDLQLPKSTTVDFLWSTHKSGLVTIKTFNS